MANVVQMDEPLTFGKRNGWTGKELLDSPSGRGYLVWVYNNTDIQIDARIVGVLKLMGLVEFKRIRLNSVIDGKRSLLNPKEMEAVRNNISKLRAQISIPNDSNLTGTVTAEPGSFTGDFIRPLGKEKVNEAFEKAIGDIVKKPENLEPLRINCSSRFGVRLKGYN